MPKLGATGEYPDGQLNPDDEGELKMAMVVDKAAGVIILDFGKQVKWLGLDKKTAQALAYGLLERAEQL